FRNTFGVGLKLKMGGDPDGIYDGQTELDTMTRLSLAFLDGFATTGIRDPKERPMREAIPVIAKYMARDIRRYIQIYRNYMPTEVLLYNFKSLIIFELFIYSLKLFTAITELIEDGEKMPLAMLDDLSVTDFSPPELFLDFTSGTNLFAKEMATACVRRDLELMQRFIYDNITLRTLDRYVGGIRGNIQSKKIVEDILGNEDGGPEYLQGLLRLLKHPQISLRIEVAAQRDEEDIRKVNRTDGADDEISRDESTNEIEIERITSAAESDFERTVLLIVDAQRAIISQNVTSWYTSVGGLSKPFGILGGHSKNRRSLRYAPSNDLLALLVQMAALDITAEQTGRLEPQSIRLRDFLTYLYNRFGILVDRPPQEFTGAEYVAAAQDNLRAMLRRLQQMGVFRDLSDDFTVQRLTPPYADAPKEAVQS
ncbi:MAG: hypothetical protein NTZ05_03045, partial [Chloroflexi bacterium]|nr:hypothetical protein [Chloroflexota bacterium]